MPTDRYGLSLSTTSQAARDAYVAGCDLLLTLYPGAAAAFARAVEDDPGFALAHAGLARARQAAGDIAGAKAAIATAAGHAARSGGREASHVDVFARLIGGRAEEALTAIRTHLDDWPRDAMVATLAANQTGLIGMSGRARREEEQLAYLAALADHYGDDWWFNGHYAMALSELGDFRAARPRIERSLGDQPRNAAAVHAFAHLLYETDERAEAIRFLEAWLADYPSDGGLHGHLSWHLAMVKLQAGDVAEGHRLYHDGFGTTDYRGPMIVRLMDTTSFLWRAELAGHAQDRARWEELHDFARRTFPRPGVPYADWHVALTDAVTSGGAQETPWLRELDEVVRGGRYPAGHTVLSAARAFSAFRRGDFMTSIAEIRSMFGERERLCGSRAQIDLVEFTLLASLITAGRWDEAKDLLASRRPGPRSIPVAALYSFLPL